MAVSGTGPSRPSRSSSERAGHKRPSSQRFARCGVEIPAIASRSGGRSPALSLILGAVSLQGLTDQGFEELYRARDLFGPAPQAADFSRTATVAFAHESLGCRTRRGDRRLAGCRQPGLHRRGRRRCAQAQPSCSGRPRHVWRDEHGGRQLGATGRRLMDGIIAETHAGVAAIAPTTDTPAGRRQLTEYLQNQLRRAQAVVQGGAQRSAMAAAAISSATGGYGSAHGDTGAASSPDDVIVDDGSNGNSMMTVRGATFKQDGGGPAPAPPPPPGAAPQIGPFPVPPTVAAAAPPGPPDLTGGLLMPSTAPPPPHAEDPLTSLLQKLTQSGPGAALTPDEIRALVDAELQGKLNDAQRFNLWEMLKKAGEGCVLAGTAAGIGGLITGPLDPAVIAGGCAGGALTGGGGYALD